MLNSIDPDSPELTRVSGGGLLADIGNTIVRTACLLVASPVLVFDLGWYLLSGESLFPGLAGRCSSLTPF